MSLLIVVTILVFAISATAQTIVNRKHDKKANRLLEDMQWEEGKYSPELRPSFDDMYEQTKLYELERWWDKNNLPPAEYANKYPDRNVQLDGPAFIIRGADKYVETKDIARALEKLFDKEINSTYRDCNCDACTEYGSSYLNALKRDQRRTRGR